MKKQVVICDNCGREGNSNCFGFSVKIGRTMDASGNGYNTEWKDFDFCRGCISEKMQILFDEKRLLN